MRKLESEWPRKRVSKPIQDPGMYTTNELMTTAKREVRRLSARYSRTLLLSAMASLLAACGGGSGSAPAGAATPASAAVALLTWDAVADPNVGGYRVYYGTTSRAYTQTVTVQRDTQTYTPTGLDSGVTYYFSVTAYDSSNVESGFSNEVSTNIP
jgi:hypothetical protein